MTATAISPIILDSNNQDSVNSFAFELQCAIHGIAKRGDYTTTDGILVRIKDHVANWSNFFKDIEDGADKILSVVLENKTETRRRCECRTEFYEFQEWFQSEINDLGDWYEGPASVSANEIIIPDGTDFSAAIQIVRAAMAAL